MSAAPVWTYGFEVRPGLKGWSTATFNLFVNLATRVEMDFTEAEWSDFRTGVERDGLVLHEVDRRPWTGSEPVL